MASSFSAFLSLTSLLVLVSASALKPLLARQADVTPLTQTDIDSFMPYIWYASTTACDPSTTATWSCGVNCDANPDFEPTASGGDGADVQFWYVGYDPSLDSVIVAHQGTDVTKILPILTDLDLILTPLNPTLFPGIPSDVLVHSGFKESQEDTASVVLQDVKKTMDAKGTSNVTVVGHSLGAAITMIDALYLALQLPNATVTMRGLGTPRVGNDAFANFVDAHVMNLRRLNNKMDPIPTLPDMLLGYHHPNGEVHIMEDDIWVSCPGHDNPSPQCSTGDVNLVTGNLSDHGGPYNGITIGC